MKRKSKNDIKKENKQHTFGAKPEELRDLKRKRKELETKIKKNNWKTNKKKKNTFD
jgi:hypothetical protein